MEKLSLLLFFSWITTASFAQIADQAAIDALFAEWTENTPGCALGIMMDGELAYAKGYGLANMEYDIPNAANSVFRIGSTSKQFTAACIVLLAEQEKLKLDNTLDQYFPDFPTYAKQITIRHLLNHTSGIRDYLSLAYLKGLRGDDYYEDEDLMRWLINQEDLNFAPGEEFLYSNSGYWLLGQIVNEAAGMNMAEFAEQAIFTPLEMSDTHFHNDHNQIVKNRASGYYPVGEEDYQISMTTLDMIGDGGIFTTIEDIKKWDDAYYDHAVLSEAFWAMMTEQGVLNSGEKIDYAAGLFIEDYNGLPTISHGGAFVGFRAELLRFPEQHVSIAIFANRGDANPSGLAYQVADIVLMDLFVDTDDSEEDIVDPSELEEDVISEAYELEQLTGAYEIQTGMLLEVSIENDSLHILQTWNNANYNIIRIEGSTFQIPGEEGLSFTFAELKDQYTQELVVDQEGDKTICTRKEMSDISAIDPAGFVGSFYSKELDVVYQVLLEEETLQLQIGSRPARPLNIADVDQLASRGRILRFSRRDGEIVGFELDAGRVKNLKFEKR